MGWAQAGWGWDGLGLGFDVCSQVSPQTPSADHWDGLPEGRADEVADRRERADAATRRYFDDDWDGLPDDALEEGPGDDNDAWAWGEVDDFEGED